MDGQEKRAMVPFSLTLSLLNNNEENAFMTMEEGSTSLFIFVFIPLNQFLYVASEGENNINIRK